MFRLVVLTAMMACTFAKTVSPVLAGGKDIRERQALTPLSKGSFLGGAGAGVGVGGGRSFGGHGISNFGNAFPGDSGFGKTSIGGSRGVIVDPLSRSNINRNTIIGGKGGTLNAFSNNNGYGNGGFPASSISYGGEHFGASNTLDDSVYGLGSQNIGSSGFNKGNSVTSRGYGNNVFGDKNVFGGDKGLRGAVFGDGYSSGVGINTGYNGINRGSLGGSNPFSRDSILGKSGFGNKDLYSVDVAGAGRDQNVYGGFGDYGAIGTDSGYGGSLNGKGGLIGGKGYNTFGRDSYGLGGKAGGIGALPGKGGNILSGNGFPGSNYGGKSFSGKSAFGDNLY